MSTLRNVELLSGLQHVLSSEIETGEHLLWSAQPDPYRRASGFAVASLVVIAVLAAASRDLLTAAPALSHSGSHLIVIAFAAAIGTCGIAALLAPFVAFRLARKTIVAVTDMRAISVTITSRVKVRSYSARNIHHVRSKIIHGRRGDVVFMAGRGMVTFNGVDDAAMAEGILNRIAESGPANPESSARNTLWTDTLSADLRALIEHEFEEGERLLWTGRPNPARVAQVWVSPAFICLAVAVYAGVRIGGAMAGPGHGLHIFPYSTIALYGILAICGVAICVAAWNAYADASRTGYAITNLRVISVTRGSGRPASTFFAADIGTTERMDLKFGTSDLVLPRIRLYGIANGRKVERMVRHLADAPAAESIIVQKIM